MVLAVARTGRARREDTLAIDELYDELEPFQGVYDWDEAFRQNPDEPAYEIPEGMRTRVHG
jgi:hypothetical protein